MEKEKNFKSRETIKKYLFVSSIMVLPLLSFAIFYVYINIDSFFMSFTEIDINNNSTWVGFKNFVSFFESIKNSDSVGRAFTNSIKNYWIVFAIQTPLAFIFSYYFAKKMPFAKVFSFVFMLPMIVSGFVYALVYKKFVDMSLIKIMASLGYENFPNIITDRAWINFNNVFFSIWCSFGSATLLYSNSMSSIDKEIVESSKIDGASDLVEFFEITMPIIWPTITITTLTGLVNMFTWSGSLLTFYMYNAPPETWGLGYYFTITIKNNAGVGYMNYPMVACSGLIVTIMSLPIIFGTKWWMNKVNKLDN